MQNQVKHKFKGKLQRNTNLKYRSNKHSQANQDENECASDTLLPVRYITNVQLELLKSIHRVLHVVIYYYYSLMGLMYLDQCNM